MSEQTTTKENVTMNARKITSASRLLTRRKVLVAMLFALAAMLLPAASASAAGTPARPISAIAMSAFAPGSTFSESGPQYYLRVVNVGSGPTSGPVTITDTLPGSLSPQEAGVIDEWNNTAECEVSGQTTTCVDETNFERIQPGQQIQVPVLLKTIPGDASGTVVNEATVSGGGAAPAST